MLTTVPRTLARIAGLLALAAVLAPAAAAHNEVPQTVQDPLHPLGLPVAQPWAGSGELLEQSISAQDAFARAAAAIIPGTAPPKVECIGDGTSGKRVQLMYVRDVDDPDNYAADKASIGGWALGADRIYRESAAKTQGPQRIRFVHDGDCNLSILNVVVDDPNDLTGTATPLDDVRSLVKAQGFTDPNRKYVMFVDTARVLCGGAHRENDDSPGQTNASNGGTGNPAGYARLDFTKGNCRPEDWIMAHELGHDLGAVQLSAPHSNTSGHCTDEDDRLCQNDPGSPPTTSVCTGPDDEQLLDCNNDDYFNAHPAAGSYLDTHWNLARSDFLASDPASQWGFVQADDPIAASYIPSEDTNQNSTNAKNTIVRTSMGVYDVTFTNLANYGGRSGTTLATARGSAGEHCTTSAWSSNGTPDTTVTVRCFSPAGTPADVQFDASYIRPTSTVGDFAYLWQDDETNTTPGRTPSMSHQFNSMGGVNTITRNAIGNYTVRLPGLGTQGGTVKVTAFNGGADFCKVEWWAPAGADELVEILCFDSTGAAADSKFTMAFADGTSILGSNASSGYVYADRPTSPAYTPTAATNFDATGGLNTAVRTGTGRYTVTMPGLGSPSPSAFPIDRGTVHVTSTTAAARRCEVVSWSSLSGPPGGPIPLSVDVACQDPAGNPADSRFVLQFSH